MSGKNGGISQVYNIIDGAFCQAENGEWFHIKKPDSPVYAAPRSGPKDLTKALAAAKRDLAEAAKLAGKKEEDVKINVLVSDNFNLVAIHNLACDGPVIVIFGGYPTRCSEFTETVLKNMKELGLPGGIFQLIFAKDAEEILGGVALMFNSKIRVIRNGDGSWPQKEPGMDY